jgi:hypothetical protein
MCGYVAESLSQHDEIDVLPILVSGIMIGKRRSPAELLVT